MKNNFENISDRDLILREANGYLDRLMKESISDDEREILQKISLVIDAATDEDLGRILLTIKGIALNYLRQGELDDIRDSVKGKVEEATQNEEPEAEFDALLREELRAWDSGEYDEMSDLLYNLFIDLIPDGALLKDPVLDYLESAFYTDEVGDMILAKLRSGLSPNELIDYVDHIISNNVDIEYLAYSFNPNATAYFKALTEGELELSGYPYFGLGLVKQFGTSENYEFINLIDEILAESDFQDDYVRHIYLRDAIASNVGYQDYKRNLKSEVYEDGSEEKDEDGFKSEHIDEPEVKSSDSDVDESDTVNEANNELNFGEFLQKILEHRHPADTDKVFIRNMLYAIQQMKVGGFDADIDMPYVKLFNSYLSSKDYDERFGEHVVDNLKNVSDKDGVIVLIWRAIIKYADVEYVSINMDPKVKRFFEGLMRGEDLGELDLVSLKEVFDKFESSNNFIFLDKVFEALDETKETDARLDYLTDKIQSNSNYQVYRKSQEPDELDEEVNDTSGQSKRAVISRFLRRLLRPMGAIGFLAALGVMAEKHPDQNVVNTNNTTVVRSTTNNSNSSSNEPSEVKEVEVSNKVPLKTLNKAEKLSEMPDGFKNYLAYLEKQNVWSEEQAKRVRLVTKNGNPVSGYEFVDDLSAGSRSNWKVKSKMPKDLMEKKTGWTQEDLNRSECCDVIDGISYHRHGYSVYPNGTIRPTTGALLEQLDKWSKSEALLSGLLDNNRNLITGFQFAEKLPVGELRTEQNNWKIIPVPNTGINKVEVKDVVVEISESKDIGDYLNKFNFSVDGESEIRNKSTLGLEELDSKKYNQAVEKYISKVLEQDRSVVIYDKLIDFLYNFKDAGELKNYFVEDVSRGKDVRKLIQKFTDKYPVQRKSKNDEIKVILDLLEG